MLQNLKGQEIPITAKIGGLDAQRNQHVELGQSSYTKVLDHQIHTFNPRCGTT